MKSTKLKTKQEKGITLIALIITIVVLLVLAAVAISSIKNDGIISKAQDVTNKYNEAQTSEKNMLDEYLNYLEPNGGTSGGWVQNGLTVTDGTITLNVGDYVNYTSGVAAVTAGAPVPDTVGWQVLGAEDGELLLISAEVLNQLELEGREGYNTALTSLKTMCEVYGKGKHATGARSINVDDINRITGYNPNSTGDGTKFLAGAIREYGKTITYSITAEGEIKYTDGGEISGTYSFEIFIHPDGRILASDTEWEKLTSEEKEGLTRTTEPITVTNNAYIYNPTTLTIDFDNLQPAAFAADNEVYKMLFGSNYATLEAEGAAGTKATSKYTGEIPYRLASPFEVGDETMAMYGVFCVSNSLVYCDGSGLWKSYGSENSDILGVRPVVSLKSGVKLSSAGAGSWTLPE